MAIDRHVMTERPLKSYLGPYDLCSPAMLSIVTGIDTNKFTRVQEPAHHCKDFRVKYAFKESFSGVSGTLDPDVFLSELS